MAERWADRRLKQRVAWLESQAEWFGGVRDQADAHRARVNELYELLQRKEAGMVTAEDLHRAAEMIATATPAMDDLATAVADFLRESEVWTLGDGGLEEVDLDRQSVGYGAMLGVLAERTRA